MWLLGTQPGPAQMRVKLPTHLGGFEYPGINVWGNRGVQRVIVPEVQERRLQAAEGD